VEHIRNPDKDHEDFVFGRRRELIIHQSRMISNALRDKSGTRAAACRRLQERLE
jgi:hypothetical protein